jgi:hypothetical protein
MTTQTDVRRRASSLSVVLKVLALTVVLFVCFSVASSQRGLIGETRTPRRLNRQSKSVSTRDAERHSGRRSASV